ncbi:IclR family transcriptional regulator [Mesorhizobium sp. DCY119]|uniref:IclR family transcriptional regulator n=1 Tax=Mesorhizobium sp. DCY119 TaxID=2108445 RepID=UPI000E71DFF6|nr:IclR family transcriptional regulator [Mesorhizobium sp. DCY119]RJG40473.1 IclR family transcriptional regulator [Mesorhizobium sp. DCY119]
MKVDMGSDHIVQSATKVLRALEILCASPVPVSLEQLAARLKISSATAYRTVNTLVCAGYAKENGRHGGYVATLLVAELSAKVSRSFDFQSGIRASFRPVGMKFGETITIAKIDGDAAVYIDKIQAGASLVFFCDVGRRLPLHIGAAARCLLSYMTDEEFEFYLSRELEARTSATVTDAEALRRLRRDTLEHEFASSVDEVDIGVSAIAVPIFGPNGIPIAAAAIANTTSSWSESDRLERVAVMKAAAASVGSRSAASVGHVA